MSDTISYETERAIRDQAVRDVLALIATGSPTPYAGIMSKKKRAREDADLRIKAFRDSASEIAGCVRARFLENRADDPLQSFINMSRQKYLHGGKEVQEAIEMANRGWLELWLSVQIAGPFSNSIPPNTEYTIRVTERGQREIDAAVIDHD